MRNQVYAIDLYVIDERCYPTGVKFLLVNSDEYNIMANNENIQPYSFTSSDGIAYVVGNSKGHHYENNGLLMSLWLRTQSIHKFDVSEDDIAILRQTFGNMGFGGRNRACLIGTNIYMGKRDINNRAMLSPVEGPCKSFENQYYRSYYNALYQPYSEKLANILSHYALKHQIIYDPLMSKVLPGGNEPNMMKSCRVKIINMGSPNEYIGFANELHVDSCDKISGQDCNIIDESIK